MSSLAEYVVADAARESRLREEGLWNDDTILTYLERHARENPDGVAIIDGQNRISWSELQSMTATAASGLAAAGVQHGDVVAVQLPNSIEFVLSFLGCAMIGAAFQPVHLPYRGNDLEFLLKHSGARAFVGLSGDEKYSPVAAVKALDGPEVCVGVGARQDDVHSWDDVIAASGDTSGLQPLQATDPFLLLYTSGTTSSPKGVPHASTTILSGVRACSEELGFSSDDRFLILSYFSHMWGITAFTIAIYAGSATVLTPKFTPEIFGAALQDADPTVVIGAPVHILKADEEGVFDRFSFNSLKILITSGSGFPAGSFVRVSEKLKPARILELWGMTEVAPICVTRPDSDLKKSMGTVGPCLPHSQVRVIGGEGEVLPPGSKGELQINASSVFCGYLRNPEANASSFDDEGWFDTGDVATIDADGIVQINGRTKEVINRGGVKFSVTDVEKAVVEHDAISMCSIVPVPDSIMGEKACCVAVVSPSDNVGLADLCEYLSTAGVEKTKWPEYLVTVDAMPMTPTGKPQREKVIQIAVEATGESAS